MNSKITPSLLTGAVSFALLCNQVYADDTWDGDTDGTWATATNWGTAAPGTGEIATFSGAGNGNTTIDLGAGVTVGGIVFDTVSAAAYTIGAGVVGTDTLTLDNGGSITMSSTVAADQLFNANLVLGNDATASTYTFTNASTTNSLSVAGTITGATGGTADAKTLAIAGAGATNLSGIISDGGASSLALSTSGGGTLTLTGANTFTGGGTLDGGTVNINNASALGTGAYNFNGGLTFDNTSGAAITNTGNNAIILNGAVTFTGSNALNLGTGNVTLTANRTINVLTGGELTIGGVIDDGASSFRLTVGGGANGVQGGTLVLNGNNTYNLGTTIGRNNTLRVGHDNALGTGTVTLGREGAFLELTNGVDIGNALTMANSANPNGARGIRVFGTNATAEFSGTINKAENTAGDFRVIAADGQTLTLSGVISNNANSNVNLTGAGLVIISGNNTHDEQTILTGVNGTVRLAHDNATGSAGLALNSTGATAELAEGINISETLNVANGGNQKILALQTGATSAEWSGAVIINERTASNYLGLSSDGAGVLTISGNISSAVAAANSDIRKDGTGTVVLSGSNTYVGDTIVTNGTLQLGVADGVSSGAGVGNFSMSADTGLTATLDLNGFDQTLNGFSSSGLGSNIVDNTAVGPATLTIGENDGTGTFNGVIQDTGGDLAITKTGAGSITLTGANTYTSTTTVSGGTLSAENNKALGDTSLLAVTGGTLDVGGADAVGMLTLGANADLTLSTGTINFDLGTAFDQIVSSGTGMFDIDGGTFELDVMGEGFDYENTYQVLSGFGGSNSVSGLSFTGYDDVGYTASLDTSGLLTFTPVPEPSAFALFSLGVLGLCARRRR
ncbi:MAG: autotransporter-associated beta strand repeat-containing protein [Luteolibacter sp.]